VPANTGTIEQKERETKKKRENQDTTYSVLYNFIEKFFSAIL
jgi:hypothetical protein